MTNLIPNPSSLLQHLSQWWTTTPIPTAILTAAGFLTLAKTAYNILDFIYFFLRPSKLHHYLHLSPTGPDSKQPWALVTGSTDGIGKAFAHELAGTGFNVVIHGRNPAKIEAVLEELRTGHPGRQFRSICVDASRVACVNCLEQKDSGGLPSSAIDFDAILASLSDLNLTVFISNAGGGLRPVYRTLDQRPPQDLASNVSLNALFPLHLLHHLLPTLIKNSPSLVICIGSLADNGLPYLTPYGPAKSFLMSLAGCVARDLRMEGHRDVEVIGMRSGRVTDVSFSNSRLPGGTKRSFAVPDARTFARAALGRVGCGRVECVPYFGHAVQQALAVEMMPGWVRERLFMRIMGGLRDEERRKGVEGKRE